MDTSAQFVDQLIEHSPISVQVLDRYGVTIRVNDYYLRLFGVKSREEVEGVLNLRTHPSMPEHNLSESLERAYAGEVVYTPAVTFKSPHGPQRVVRAVLFPIRDARGDVDRVVLVHEDVTELHASESALERRYAQISTLQDAFRAIGNELSTEAVLENVLSAMERLCQIDACAIWRMMPGEEWKCLASHGLSARYISEIEEAYAHHPPYWRAPFEEVRADRAITISDVRTNTVMEPVRPFLEREGIRRVMAAPMHSGHAVDGTIVFYGCEPGDFDSIDVEIALLLADQAAIALHNADLYEQANLAATEARILYQVSSILTQSLSLPEVLRALTGTVAPMMGLDRVAVSIVDEDRDESVLIAYMGMDPEELRRWGADQPRRISEQNEATRRLIATGEPIVIDEIGPDLLGSLSVPDRTALEAFGIRSIMVVALRDGGRTVGTMSFDSPGRVRHWTEQDLRLAQGVAAQAAIAIRNARLFEEARAAREKLEERVRERTAELRAAHNEVISSERLAAIGIMAREVAHGLRNPLNVVSTSLYYLRSRFPEPDEKVLRHFDTITRSVEQSANMINQLMSLAGSRQPDLAPVDLNQLVQQALQDRFTAEEVQWTADLMPDLPYVLGDWTQLNHAVKALIGNAAGAKSGSTVLIRTGRDGDAAFLAVGDHRSHLGEEELRALFEPFFVSATQWTGLGLSVARQITVKHGGNLTVEEEEGVTWFRMSLPLAPESS